MTDASTVETKYWYKTGDGRFVCTVCPRECKLKPGQRGMCFVRMAHPDGRGIVLTSYGRSTGFCVDPIEKKPLFHFLPGSSVLSFGTAGCNLQCAFCQNWEISKTREIDKLADAASPEAIADAARKLDCRSVAFTYNDPVIFHEYAIDIAQACRERGVKTVAVSAGYVHPEPRAEFYARMDAANIDLKAFTPDFYRRLTKSDLNVTLDTLKYIRRETSCWLEITMLLIPGENDDPDEIAELARWVRDQLGVDVPLHFTAFHPDFRMREHSPTPHATLIQARDIAMRQGLSYVYVGNVVDRARSSTYCHGCGARLIGRDVHSVLDWHLDAGGRCRTCGTPCAGVFTDAPGTWGTRRQPVRLGA
jgi:pyruvate formate lyase activating enzyme